jgi:hypothetical protein
MVSTVAHDQLAPDVWLEAICVNVLNALAVRIMKAQANYAAGRKPDDSVAAPKAAVESTPINPLSAQEASPHFLIKIVLFRYPAGRSVNETENGTQPLGRISDSYKFFGEPIEFCIAPLGYQQAREHLSSVGY